MKHKLLVVLCIAIAVASLGYCIWWVGTWTNQSSTLGVVLGSSIEIHQVEATEELCKEAACVEGWKTDVGNYLRFKDEGRAEYWASILGDKGRRNSKLVLDMRSVNLEFDQLRIAIDLLYDDRDW